MPKRVSDVFQVDAESLRSHNVFNGFIEIDSKFYVEPRLLAKTSACELKNSYDKVTSYFDGVLEDVLNFIRSRRGFEAIVEKLIFSEIPLAGLGYSINHNGGKGIGVQLANSLSETIVEIGQLGILDPMIFELAGLFERGIGSDRISDMVIHILLPELAQFSCRIAESLKLPKAPYSTFIGNRYFDGLPCYSTQGVLLVPQDILTSLPLAYSSWTNADSIAIHNKELREYVNKMIGRSWFHSPTWEEVIKKKDILKSLILENPELMKDLLNRYKGKSASSYDFKMDPEGEFRWHDSARDYANRFPLDIRDLKDKSNEETLNVIFKHFSKLVKSGLCVEFYKESGDFNSEKVGQLILLELLECYVEGNYFSVRYNPNDGIINLYRRNFHGEVILSEIILKYTSTRGISEYYERLLERIQRGSALSHTTLVLIRLNGGNPIIDKLDALDRKHTHNMSKTFRRFDIDGRIEIIGGRKRPFR
jgi:hypothetical protein